MTWFYLHCVVAVVILIADAKGTLEPALNKFEEKIGIYTPPDTTETEPLQSFQYDPFLHNNDSTYYQYLEMTENRKKDESSPRLERNE